MSSKSAVRVLVVDDHKVVRAGLRTLLSLHDGIEVVGEAGDGREALDACAEVDPDVVLMDMKMPVMDGPTATGHIHTHFSQVKVIALTSFDEEALVRRALEAGAIGYLLKDADEDEIIAAIRLAGAGRGILPASVMNGLVNRSSGDLPHTYRARITEREQDVLGLVARGLTNAQIAHRLVISVSTVNFHVHNLLEKLGARTRTEAVSIAVREGLVEL